VGRGLRFFEQKARKYGHKSGKKPHFFLDRLARKMLNLGLKGVTNADRRKAGEGKKTG
jgi:hypothetical protein